MSVLRLSVPQGHLEVDPSTGGRVTALSYDGFELLSGPEVNPTNFGSTYWPSPQSLWGWPPVDALDSAPYEVSGREPLSLRSPEAVVGGARVVLEKTFALSSGPRSTLVVDTRYVLTHSGGASIRVAGWEISRVPPDGLTFYPTGDHEITTVAPHFALVPERVDGISFFDHRLRSEGKNQKLHADGREGFLAHLVRRDTGGVLFLKLFEDTQSHEQAEGEGEVEIFSNEDGRYVEVEVQGVCALLGRGERSDFACRWVIAPVDDAVARDRTRLVAFARSLALEFRVDPSRRP